MSLVSNLFIIFVAGAVLLYYLLPKKMRWWGLLLTSYIYYLAAGTKYFPFLLFSTIITYLCGLAIEHEVNQDKKKAKRYLINPVQKSFVVENLNQFTDMPVSGESALSNYSMLNPSVIESVAIDKSMAKEYTFKKIDERWEDNKDMIRIEFWKYNPDRFSKNGMVDPISLCMSLSDVEDERVEGSIEEMLEEYAW